MQRPKSINAAFKAAKPELRNYVIALESENAKLHRQIAKLQVQDISKQNRIAALEKENKELTKKHGFKLQINLANENQPKPPESSA